MAHRPVVKNFKVRPITFPDGHWMNRFWGPLASGLMSLIGRFPTHRYVLRAHPETKALLNTDQPLIFACTHQDLFDCYNGLPRVLPPDRKLAAIVSYSRDGGLAAMALRMLGYEIVRGSSSRGGGEGLMMLKSMVTSGTSILMACDGPKAPLGDIKPGIVKLAAASEAPIIPLRAWGTNRMTLRKSWSRSVVSVPFHPVAVCLGKPIEAKDGAKNTRRHQLEIAQGIVDLAKWANQWAHGTDIAPFTVAES